MKRTPALRAAFVSGVALATMLATGTAALARAGSGGSSPTGPAPCTSADTATCLLPFPNNYNTVVDRRSATGLRVDFTADEMPTNVLGQSIDPTEWNRQDGFSPGEPILVDVPGIDLAKSGIPGDTNVGASLAHDAGVVLINTRTGKRTPYWAELDAHAAGDAARQLLIIRPAVAMQEGTRYVVVLRNLKDASGNTIAAPAATAQYATGAGLPHGSAAARDAKILADAQHAGVSRRSVYMAWDFTIASEKSLTGRALAMRDSAFRALGNKAPAFQVASVTDYTADQNALISRTVTGTVSVPSYLTGNGGPGSRLHYGPAGGNGLPATPDALPTPSGTTFEADFVCNIPRSATATTPAHLSLYGHGLLGSPTEISAANVEQMGGTYDFMFCATSWIGLAAADTNYAAATFSNLTGFPSIPDRLQQSFLNFLFLGRDMDTRSGFASDPAFQDANGKSLLDVAGGLHYDGNSQGGINGGALTALSQDFTRAVLGVPGEDYSTLLQRSVDFDPFQQIMNGYYPDPEEQQLIFGLLQMLWDRGEADGYAQHITTNPLPGTPKHTVLMDVAFGDHQVANDGSEVEARTIGAAIHEPIIAPGWSAEQVPFWGIPAISHYPYRGSAIFVWNSQAALAPPPTNLAPESPQYGADPHSFPRSQPEAQQQKSVFLLTGEVIDPCGGAACPS